MNLAFKMIGDFDVTVEGDRALIEGAYVQGVGPRSIWIKNRGDDLNVPKSLMLDCDQDKDEIEIGDVITFEIPLWKAKELGIAE